MEKMSEPVCKCRVRFASQGDLQTFILHDHCYDTLPSQSPASENTETDESSRENIKSEDEMSPNDKASQTDLAGEDLD